jgi:hypothetical protein
MMKVTFNDFFKNHRLILQEIDMAINNGIDKLLFVRGRHVTEFEECFASLIGTRYCLSRANELLLQGICFWRKGREKRKWVEFMGEKGG